MKKNDTGLHNILAGDWLIILLLFGGLVTGLLLYPHLPEQVPSHWNFRGEVDAYSSRFWGAFGIPFMTTGIYLLMVFLPFIDPKKHNYSKFTRAYQILKAVLVIFMMVLYGLVILSSFGHQVPVGEIVLVSIGFLFVIMGVCMKRFKHNYFVGIKTPWTLADERVWQKTHQLGGKVWVFAGFLGIFAAFLGGITRVVILGISLSIALIIPIVYSYLEYRRLQ
ncbi:MAG: SdpI family protein [Dethiobacteria bacterium]|jgi:uncharacterized membrane protein